MASPLALSFDSDLVPNLQPFPNAEGVVVMTTQQISTLLTTPISKKFPLFDYEKHANERAIPLFFCAGDSNEKIDRRGNTFNRGAELYTQVATAFKLKSVTVYSKSSEEAVTQDWYQALFAPILSYASSIIPGLEFNQNIDASITKAKYKRDFNFWLLFRNLLIGEIKQYIKNTQDDSEILVIPEKELITKTKAIDKELYGTIEYIIGFAAGNNIGQFYRVDIKKCSLEKVLKPFNLNDTNDRIALFLVGWNLLRWMKTVAQVLPEYYPPETLRPNVFNKESNEKTVIKRFPSFYSKTFTLPLSYQSTWTTVYKKIEGIAHAAEYTIKINDKITKPSELTVYDADIKVELIVRPLGKPCKPANSNELLRAIRAILEFVQALHIKELTHRDLRWQNIIQISKPNTPLEICVIDFETAAPSEQPIFWFGQPQFYTDAVYSDKKLYSYLHDMFQVGTMIGLALLLRSPQDWTPETVIAWDRFADYLRSCEVTATQALAQMAKPNFPFIVLPAVSPPVLNFIQPTVENLFM